MIKNLLEIKEAVDIVEVAKRYINTSWKREGRLQVTTCPFHHEKTGSFKIDPKKQTWTCYGSCNKGGDVISLIQELQNLGFIEATKEVAGISSTPIEWEDEAPDPERQKKLDAEKAKMESLCLVMDRVHILYKAEYPTIPPTPPNKKKSPANKKIDIWGRDYTIETLEKFGLVWSPGKNYLKGNAEKHGFKVGDLYECGLLNQNEERGEYYDFFYKEPRLLFPIRDHYGKLVAFAGRNKTGKDPKYLNLRETTIYKKHKILYGLGENQADIRKAAKCYIVEGYTDLMTMWQYGIRNVVATCGTALSIQQVRLLKRYCDEVVIMRDGDLNESGLKATRSDIDTLLMGGFTNVKVLFMEPDKKTKTKHDPDSFLRQHGSKGFEGFLLTIQDGILWRVMEKVNPNDEHSKIHAVKLAGRILYLIKDLTTQNHYKNQICKPGRLSGLKKEVENEIHRLNVEKRKKSSTARDDDGLTMEQRQMFDKYRIFIDYVEGEGGRIYTKKGRQKIALTNFSISPEYFLGSFQNPERMIVVTNVNGESNNVCMPTRSMNNFGEFADRLADYDNYWFEPECGAKEFKLIRNWMYDQMTKVAKITKLGYHKRDFYVWNNGITVGKDFQRGNIHGIVEKDDFHYILPGRHFLNTGDDNYDDKDSVDEHLDNFTYYDGANPATLQHWQKLFLDLYGDNGVIALAFGYASFIGNDFISAAFDGNFPILNLVGLPERGKSSLATSIMALGGVPNRLVDLSNVTKAFLSDSLETIRNGLIGLDEYDNHKLDDQIYGILKSIFGGMGRAKKQMDGGKGSVRTRVLSGVILMGQHPPTRDPAMPSRCITLNINYSESPEATKWLDEIKALESSGKISHVGAYLQRFRNVVKDNFKADVDKARKFLRKKDASGKMRGRILMNHAILLAVMERLDQVIEFPKYKGVAFIGAFRSILVNCMNTKVESNYESSELSGFWRIFQFLVEDKENRVRYRHDYHFRIDYYKQLSIKTNEETKASVKVWIDENPDGKKILAFNIDRIYEHYAGQAIKTGKPFGHSTLKTYLMQDNAYLGLSKAYNFDRTSDRKQLQALVFDLEKLPISYMPTSDDALRLHGDEATNDPDKKDEYGNPVVQGELFDPDWKPADEKEAAEIFKTEQF